jgi:TonB-linked SusC/RagA family outer membrane protein
MIKIRIILSMFILLSLLTGTELLAQESFPITGEVLFRSDKGVSDVSISIESKNISPVYTDSAGHFSIDVPTGKAWLKIDPAHTYKSRRIYIGNQKHFVIYLTRNENTSGYDMLNTHHGLMEKRDVISSLSYLDNRESTNLGYSTIDQYMNGSMTGLYNINQTSVPGSGSYSSIRGSNSIYASNQPLYIIDGVMMENPGIYTNLISGFSYNPLASIKPEDVSSVTVLKDASATAIYGMKGANGVIIIETLNTTVSETKINFSAHSGLAFKPRNTPVLDADQYRNYANELLQSANFPEEDIQKFYPGLILDQNSDNTFYYAHNTNWQEEIYRNGNTSNAYLSIMGGDAVAKYGISFSFDQFNSVVDKSDFRRLGIRLVGDVNVLPWLKLYVNAYLNTASENHVEDMSNQQVSPQYVAMAKPPILGAYVYDNFGNPTNQLIDPLEFNVSNPLAVSQGYIGGINNTRFLATFRFEGELADNLYLKSLVSLNRSDLTEKVYFPNIGISPYENGEINNISKRSHNNLNAIYNNSYIEYSNTKSGEHNFYFTSGFRISSTGLQTDLRIAKNLPENDAVKNLGDGENSYRSLGGDSPVWTWVSAYASGRYGFRDKYFLDGVVTIDGSSAIGKESADMITIANQPYGLFYSVGGAWRLSNEDFLRDVSRISDLRIRASYSVSGNDDIGTYSALDYYEQVLYRGVTGIVPGRTKNLGLKHETMSMINLGVNMSMFGEKLQLTANVFENTSNDLFLKTQSEGWIWDELLARNSGSASTQGFEFEMGTFLRTGQHSSFSSSLCITGLRTKIDEIYKDQVVIPVDGGELLYQSGNQYPQYFGYMYEGVYATSEEASLINDANIPYSAGDAKYTDISGPEGFADGKISDYDKVALGSPFPDFYGGLFNRFTYKRWVVDFNFQFVLGNEIFNYKRYLAEKMDDFSNQSLNVVKRWRQDGDITNTPRALLDDNIGNSAFSSRWIEDGSYLRLKSAAIRYIIPEKFVVFQNVEFYLSGTNLFTITNYLGDPEVGRGYQNYQQGIDYGYLPNVRTIILGVKLGL